MSDETTGGASYLAALKGSKAGQSSASATAPAPARTAPQERRRSPRYRCQGSAQLREIRTGTSTWATFTDISLHGIYVEAMATFRIGSELNLILEVNGLRVEARGEVRIVYPGLGMGLNFVTMLDADRERLRDLLRSLSQPSVILKPHNSASIRPSVPNSAPSMVNPEAAFYAIDKFFQERNILSRDEFQRILKKSQTS